MIHQGLIAQLQAAHKFFATTTRCLEEADSAFAPDEHSYSVASHVFHAAQSIDWFIDGMFSETGFDMDFEKHIAEARACTSFEAAMSHFDRSVAAAAAILASKTDAELMSLLPEDSILGPAPRLAVIGALVDHTAHHRGALSVYARLIGKQPAMPYA